MAKLGFEPRVGWLQKSHTLASFPELPLQKPLGGGGGGGSSAPVVGLSGTGASAGLLGFSYLPPGESQDWPTLRRQSKAVFSKL